MTYTQILAFSSLCALVFASLAIGLPRWSQDKGIRAQVIENAAFYTGVWGICVDIEYTANATTLLGTSASKNCFNFFTSMTSTYIVQDTMTGDLSVVTREKSSLCDLYNTETQPQELAFENGFLKNTCGSYGTTSLVFAILMLAGSAFAAFCLIYGERRAIGRRSKTFLIGILLSFLTTINAIIAVSIWAKQSEPLSAAFGVSFYFAIATMVLSFMAGVSGILLQRQLKQSRADGLQQALQSPVTPQPAVHTAKPTTLV